MVLIGINFKEIILSINFLCFHNSLFDKMFMINP